MQGNAKLLGHPVHQMLIVFPLGLFATSLAFDVVRLATRDPSWAEISYWMIASGLVGGVFAAIFGFVDYLAIPKHTRAKRIAAIHGVGNVVVMTLFLLTWLMRNESFNHVGAIGPSIAGVGLALVTGWLGGELVDRLAIGVDEGAHPNAPSSLSDRPAREHSH